MPWRGNCYRITGTLWLVDSTHKGPVIPKFFPCQDIIINLKVILYVSKGMNHQTPVTQYSFVCGMCIIVNFYISSTIEIIIKQMSNSDNLHMKSYLPFLWLKWKFSAQVFLHVRIRVQLNTYKGHTWRYGECQCSFITKKLTDAGLHQAWMSMADELTSISVIFQLILGQPTLFLTTVAIFFEMIVIIKADLLNVLSAYICRWQKCYSLYTSSIEPHKNSCFELICEMWQCSLDKMWSTLSLSYHLDLHILFQRVVQFRFWVYMHSLE